jgi:hypothetical protein
MIVKDCLVTVGLPVDGGVMVAVSSSFTRIANKVASGESARHVKRNGKRQPIHHYGHQLVHTILTYLIDSSLYTACPEFGQIMREVVIQSSDSSFWIRVVTDSDPPLRLN